MWYVGGVAMVLGLMSAWVYWLNPPVYVDRLDRNLFEKNGPLEDE